MRSWNTIKIHWIKQLNEWTNFIFDWYSKKKKKKMKWNKIGNSSICHIEWINLGLDDNDNNIDYRYLFQGRQRNEIGITKM